MTDQADTAPTDEMLPMLYNELRRLASRRLKNERLDHTLEGTALVHEAYLRLMESQGGKTWDNRRHFFAAAAEAMRRILIESARAKGAQKRGGRRKRVDFQELVTSGAGATDLLLDVDDGLTLLAEEDTDAAEIVKLRLFAGLSITDAGDALEMSRSTAYENWEFARSWFAVYLDADSS